MILTEPQRRHLSELLAMERDRGAAYWKPAGSGEERCARTLERLGLLAHVYGYPGRAYELTAAGRAAAVSVEAPLHDDPARETAHMHWEEEDAAVPVEETPEP